MRCRRHHHPRRRHVLNQLQQRHPTDAPAPSSCSGNALGLKVEFGLGIPLAVLPTACALYLLLRRRGRRTDHAAPAPYPPDVASSHIYSQGTVHNSVLTRSVPSAPRGVDGAGSHRDGLLQGKYLRYSRMRKANRIPSWCHVGQLKLSGVWSLYQLGPTRPSLCAGTRELAEPPERQPAGRVAPRRLAGLGNDQQG